MILLRVDIVNTPTNSVNISLLMFFIINLIFSSLHVNTFLHVNISSSHYVTIHLFMFLLLPLRVNIVSSCPHFNILMINKYILATS